MKDAFLKTRGDGVTVISVPHEFAVYEPSSATAMQSLMLAIWGRGRERPEGGREGGREGERGQRQIERARRLWGRGRSGGGGGEMGIMGY